MVSIAEFSEDSKYTIKVVSERAGVHPVTLRAWERRYDLLNPDRLENNYRFYSERDIQVIRWITHKLDDGLSISNAVREYRTLRAKGIWPNALLSIIPPEPSLTPNNPPVFYAKTLFDALTQHRESDAKQIVNDIQSMYTLNTIFFDIFHPCLVQIGDACTKVRSGLQRNITLLVLFRVSC